MTISATARRIAASDLMSRFADRTGLTSARPPRRYLWTDAFAVCNFLALDDAELALRLVEQVHRVLGQHRPDDVRRGWLDGASEAHPTRGGLRIGKPLPERGADERGEDPLEWERDGQYFHYLTRWMHALERVARATGQPAFHDWAQQLGVTAHDRFRYVPRPGARPRMFWKMSIDLSRPVVRSMGQHDALDGYLTSLELGLGEQAASFATMLDDAALATTDPLGLGGLLVDAYRAHTLGLDAAAEALLSTAQLGLRRYLTPPPTSRLAFRELGLAIGFAAVDRWPHARERVARDASIGEEIEAHWLHGDRRSEPRYLEHEDINDVMLATRLVPDGYLGPAPR